MSRDAAFHVGLYSLCVLIASIGSRSREILLPRRSPEEPESNDIEALNRFDYQAGHFRVNGAPPVEKLKRPCAGCGSKYRSCRRRQSQRTRHQFVTKTRRFQRCFELTKNGKARELKGFTG